MESKLTLRHQTFFPSDAVEVGSVRRAFQAIGMDVARTLLGPALFEQVLAPQEIEEHLAKLGAVQIADIVKGAQLAETRSYLAETFGAEKTVSASQLFRGILDDGLAILKTNRAEYSGPIAGPAGLAGWDQLFVDDRIQVREILASTTASSGPSPISEGGMSVFELLLVPTHLGGHSDDKAIAQLARTGSVGAVGELARLTQLLRPEMGAELEAIRHRYSSNDAQCSWATIELIGRYLEEGGKVLSSAEKKELKTSRGALLQRVKSVALDAQVSAEIKKTVAALTLSSLDPAGPTIGNYFYQFQREVLGLELLICERGASPELLYRIDRASEMIDGPLSKFARDKIRLAFDRTAFDVEVKGGMTAADVGTAIGLGMQGSSLTATLEPLGAYPKLADTDSILLRIRRQS